MIGGQPASCEPTALFFVYLPGRRAAARWSPPAPGPGMSRSGPAAWRMRAPEADPAAFVFSPDGERLYVIDNGKRQVEVFR